MKEPMKLFQWSMLCMLSTTVLDNLVSFDSPLVEMLFMFLLLVLPGIGIALGVMSWRKERHTGLTIAVIVMNILLVLLGFFRLIFPPSPG
jgi:cytochrome bd-type quinol oxidase subunit 2